MGGKCALSSDLDVSVGGGIRGRYPEAQGRVKDQLKLQMGAWEGGSFVARLGWAHAHVLGRLWAGASSSTVLPEAENSATWVWGCGFVFTIARARQWVGGSPRTWVFWKRGR